MIDLSQVAWASAIPGHQGLYWYEQDGRRVFGFMRPNLTAVIMKSIEHGFNGDFGAPGLHVEGDGKWFVLDFPADGDGRKFTGILQAALDALANA